MMRRLSFALSALLLVWAVPAMPADGLTYLAHPPTTPEKHPPLIVLLHGSGADENDMVGLWHDLPPDFVVVSPRAPLGDVGSGFRWYRKTGSQPRATDLAASRKIIDLVVENAVGRFDADPKRIFLAGFSQGAVMVYEVALREPGRFRGAAVLSGSMFASEAADLAAAANKPYVTQARFFIAHGKADPRIPFGAAAAARNTLAKLGVPLAFHEYPGMGHAAGPAETRDLSAWLRDRSAIDGGAASR